MTRGSRWWGVFVCNSHADGTFQERVLLCRRVVSLGGERKELYSFEFLIEMGSIIISRKSIAFGEFKVSYVVLVWWEFGFFICMTILRQLLVPGNVGNGV